MAIEKQFILKNIDVDIETGSIHLKWINRIVEYKGKSEIEVLFERPHRRTIAKDNTDMLNEDIPDPELRNAIKKLAKWTK